MKNQSSNKYTKVCVICGKEFETSRKNTVCCSEECKHKRNLNFSKLNQASKKQVYNKICPKCGKYFSTTNNHKMFCSELCSELNHMDLVSKLNEKRKKKHTKTCPICNKSFTTTKSQVICCSELCKVQYRRKQAILRKSQRKVESVKTYLTYDNSKNYQSQPKQTFKNSLFNKIIKFLNSFFQYNPSNKKVLSE